MSSTAMHPMMPVFTTERLVDAIRAVAEKNPSVFVEKVWEHLGVRPVWARSSKIGPAFRAAARAGIIERTNDIVYTPKTGTNAARFVWKSKVYRG